MGGTPKSYILMGFSLINQPFLGTSMTMETLIYKVWAIWPNLRFGCVLNWGILWPQKWRMFFRLPTLQIQGETYGQYMFSSFKTVAP